VLLFTDSTNRLQTECPQGIFLFMRMVKILCGVVVIFGMASAQKPANQGASQGQQKTAAAASKPAELKTQAYKGTLLDASCAGAGKESSGRTAAAADQSQGCKVSANTKEFALRTDSAETLRFDTVGNARAEEAIRNKKKWSSDVAAGKPIRATVIANANGDKLTVMSIN
jgi:hypothetical protein